MVWTVNRVESASTDPNPAWGVGATSQKILGLSLECLLHRKDKRSLLSVSRVPVFEFLCVTHLCYPKKQVKHLRAFRDPHPLHL